MLAPVGEVVEGGRGAVLAGVGLQTERKALGSDATAAVPAAATAALNTATSLPPGWAKAHSDMRPCSACLVREAVAKQVDGKCAAALAQLSKVLPPVVCARSKAAGQGRGAGQVGARNAGSAAAAQVALQHLLLQLYGKAESGQL